MAVSNTSYGSKETQYAIIAETTAGTANTTSMKLIPTSAKPSITESPYRRQDVQAGVGNTPKEADIKVATKGQRKEISIPYYLDNALVMYLLENGAGKVREVATGELLFTYNHTPAEVGIGDAFSDWTGTMTYAEISPIANESQIWAGCVVKSISLSATKGTDGGLWSGTIVLYTQNEPLTDQAAPTGLVAYTLSDKVIGDLCNTSQINSVDVKINSASITYDFNPVMVGVCTDGNPIAIRKNIPGVYIDQNIVYSYDDNVPDEYKKGRLATTFPISLSDGSDFFFTTAKANPTADVTMTEVEGVDFWNLQTRAFAGTSGNLHEVQIG